MLNDKSVLAIIPARGGSKGVPGKNLRLVNGKSLLAHTIAKAQSSALIDRIVVSSEDEQILAAARLANADVPFVRPIALAADDTPSSDVIMHALKELPHYDYVVVLQVTSPLRRVEDIEQCLQLCQQKNAPACVSVTEAKESPYWMFSINEQHALLPLLSKSIPTQRQACPCTYVLNGAVYAAYADWFMQKQTFITKETIAYVMPKERSLDIDTEFDFELLDCYLKRHSSTC